MFLYIIEIEREILDFTGDCFYNFFFITFLSNNVNALEQMTWQALSAVKLFEINENNTLSLADGIDATYVTAHIHVDQK